MITNLDDLVLDVTIASDQGLNIEIVAEDCPPVLEYIGMHDHGHTTEFVGQFAESGAEYNVDLPSIIEVRFDGLVVYNRELLAARS